MKKLVFGVGINDADYVTQIKETLGYTDEGKQIQKLIWRCPFHIKWMDMMRRCYDTKHLEKNPSYLGCSVLQSWLNFSVFRSWMIEQDWEGKQLDKDLLVKDNKVYSPDTCVFIDKRTNLFLLDSKKSRGEFPIGVTFVKRYNKFQAQCSDVFTGKQKYLGRYDTAEEAHLVWLTFKAEQAKILAENQTDPKIVQALLKRYTIMSI